MRVRPSQAKRTDTGPARMLPRCFPGSEVRIDVERAICQINIRTGALEIQAGWKVLMFQHQCGLDQARDARRPVQMPNIWLERAKCAKLFFLRAHRKRFLQSCQFNLVSQHRCCAMSLDIGTCLYINARIADGLSDARTMSLQAR